MKGRGIALIGYMGVMKTSAGKVLAKMADMEFLDMDAEMERRAGMPIRGIFAEYGEAHFRDLESDLIRECAGLRGTVLSTGGGAVLRPANMEILLKNNHIVWLTAKPETVFARIGKSDTRPLAPDSAEKIGEMMRAREPYYRAFAQISVSTDQKTPEQIAREIWEHIFKEE